MTHPDVNPPTRLAVALGEWGAAGAAGTGLAWYVGLVLAGVLFDVRLYHDLTADEAGGVALVSAGIGLVAGLVVGVSAGLVFGRALPWGLLVAAAGALGGAAAPYAVSGGVLPDVVSASLAWAAVGLLTGLVACLIRRANAAAEPDEPETAEQPTRTAPAGSATTPPPRNPARSLLRVLPLLVASVCSLVAAALVGPSDAAPGLLAAGVVGLCAAGAVCGQDRHPPGR